MATNNIKPIGDQWILDGGATAHICTEKSFFQDLVPITDTLKWGSGKSVPIKGRGTIQIRFRSTNQRAELENCLYVPNFGFNLVAEGVLLQKGLSVIGDSQSKMLFKGDILVAEAYHCRALSLLDIEISTHQSFAAITKMPKQIWHERMGHIGESALQQLPKRVSGVEFSTDRNKQSAQPCEICIQSKSTKHVSREPPSMPAQAYLDLVHSDVCGPIDPPTPSGNRYFITFTDSATREVAVELMKSRSEVPEAIKRFTERAENQSGARLKRLHSDNAPEYKAKEVTDYLTKKGIVATFSAPYCPEQNGIAERINRTLLDKVRALLASSQLDRIYWGETLVTAAYLYNRTPHSALKYRTPYCAKTGSAPDLQNIRTFGSLVYRLRPIRKKLDPKADPWTLIGYGSNQWKILNEATGITTWARDVTILEGKLPKRDNHIGDQPIIHEEEELTHDYKPLYPINPVVQTPKPMEKEMTDFPSLSEPMSDEEDAEDVPPHTNLIDQLAAGDDVEMAYSAMALGAMPVDPITFKEATSGRNSSDWLAAMELEISTLREQRVWSLVKPPANRKIVRGRWVFKTKLDQNGHIDKRKARWVAKGFTQRPGEDFNETFAGTCRPPIMRALLAVAARLNWEIHQWDVRSAFPSADLEEEIYMEQPIGFEDKSHPALVCRLHKALYGLKQSARQWQQMLLKALKSLGMEILSPDQSVLQGCGVVIITHVDDLLAMGLLRWINSFRPRLSKHFDLTDLGEARYFLGMEIVRNRADKFLKLTQRGSTNQLLERYAANLKPTENPCKVGLKLEANPDQASAEEIAHFQRQSGSLMYLMVMTRPDLCYPVGLVARFMANPSQDHMKALVQIWRYLKRTRNYALTYQTGKSFTLEGYADADWGGDMLGRRSTTGYLFLLGGSAISWGSALQRTVALSSCESEYMALKEAIKEHMFLRSIFEQIPVLAKALSPDIYTDSQSAIALAKNPVHHKRTKHIEIQYHFVRAANESGDIILRHIGTENQLADALTKEVSNPIWKAFTTHLGFTNLI